MKSDRQILLMADYATDSPLWWASDGSLVELDELPLSDKTKDGLRAWAECFDEGWTPDGHRWEVLSREAFELIGRRLLEMVNDDLGDEWIVGYFNEKTGEREWPEGAPPPKANGW